MRLTIALSTALVALLPLTASAGQPAQGFRIMDQAEIAKYREELENLHGAEREKYRNQVYAQLRQRAWQHGYDMPAKPPWWDLAHADKNGFRPAEALPAGEQGTPAAQPGAAPAPQAAPNAPDMPKFVAQQKQVIEEAAQAESQEAARPSTGGAVNTPAANAYREQMRRRFDDFMARREERQRQIEERQRARWQQSLPPYAQQQPQAPAAPPAGMQAPAYPQPMQPQQPAYPQPMQPQQPYPMPQQPAYPGYPPYGYPQPAPGWY
jgi:hypothetical protein